jgi:hypothetical protein
MTPNRWYRFIVQNNENSITINGIQAENIIDVNNIEAGGQYVSSYIEMMFVSDLAKLIIKN